MTSVRGVFCGDRRRTGREGTRRADHGLSHAGVLTFPPVYQFSVRGKKPAGPARFNGSPAMDITSVRGMYLFSPADRTDTAGGTRTPREPPGRRGEPGEGKPLPRVPNPPAVPVSCVQAAPPAGYEPLTDPAGTVRGVVPLHSSPERHRDRVPDRPLHAAEADDNRRELPPIPPHCCHTFVLLHTRLNSYRGIKKTDREGPLFGAVRADGDGAAERHAASGSRAAPFFIPFQRTK